MAATEVRVMQEGILRFAQAGAASAGSAYTGWLTASGATTGLYAYVDSFSMTSARNLVAINERGVPTHFKHTMKTPIDITFNCKWTGGHRVPVTASGATVPMDMIEWKAAAKEIGATSGFYYQFFGAALISTQINEAEDGNTIALTYQALGVNGATASGYLG